MFRKKLCKMCVAILFISIFLVSCASTQVAEQNTSLLTPEVTIRETAVVVTPFHPITTEAAGFMPRFDRFSAAIQFDGGSNVLAGFIKEANDWQQVTVAYPPNTNSVDSDYALATDRLLAWGGGAGAGVANLAAGKLTIIYMATQTEEDGLPDNVVSAGWAPNGLDFAYIVATPTTYELRWRTANGEDRLLAVDVPYSLRVSPDGRFVAFTRESHYGLETAVPGLYVVEIATGKETQLSTLDRAAYGGIGLFWKPHWTPDSSQLFLYADADDDRAAEPHEAGYVWAAIDGSFSHFLPSSAFLGLWNEPIINPGGFRCLDTPVLFAANMMVIGVGECPPMVGDPLLSRPAVFTLDSETGNVALQHVLPAAETAQLLSWDVPEESVLLQEGDLIASYPMRETAE